MYFIVIKGTLLFIAMSTVVCVLGKLRCCDFTWANFKRFVLDELNADLVTCGPDFDQKNDYTRNSILNINSNPLVELNAERVFEHRRMLFKSLPNTYDRYILTRSDHMWYGPHPKLDPGYTWFMNSEFHFGISDRHWVMDFDDFKQYCEDPPKYDPDLKSVEGNLVKQVKWGPKTALFPFPMYLTDNMGVYRRLDEVDASREIVHWPFAFDYGQKSRFGTYPGRALKLSDT